MRSIPYWRSRVVVCVHPSGGFIRIQPSRKYIKIPKSPCIVDVDMIILTMTPDIKNIILKTSLHREHIIEQKIYEQLCGPWGRGRFVQEIYPDKYQVRVDYI